MFRKLMIPVDGSAFAEQAIDHGIALARAGEATLHLVLVHEGRPLAERGTVFISEHFDAQQREWEEEYLKRLVEQLERDHTIEIEDALVTGTAAVELTDYVARHGIGLIVMSTHGRGGLSRMWLGSVADRVVRRAGVPVLLVRPSEDARAQDELWIRRVLVAADGSEASEFALRSAAALCALTRADCTIVRVVVPPTHMIASRIPDTAALVRERTQKGAAEAEDYLRELTGAAHWHPTTTRTELVIGNDAAAAILRCAETDNADIIVVGTRGHGGPTRMLLGSVADKVIRGARVPVLVCPVP